MKKFILTSFIFVIATVTFAQQFAINSENKATFNPDNATFNWAETSFDFGKIKQNIPATHEFTFVNKGNAPLVISSVQASCGCTVTEYSKEPIAPGQKGYVKATYNAAKTGMFTKTVTINANAEESIVTLTIKGEVVTE